MAYVTVNVDMYEFSDDDLVEELENRGYQIVKTKADIGLGVELHRAVEQLYHKKRMGQDYERELSEIIDLTIDRIV